ncbi:hypothetical protein KPSB59_4090008 [Klebsiella quasipneumoniae subsp. quasipneumoniae]|nr:hypothetical protein KPSB59_4090008 [Klebsiella quasipneumoniae subsp. quasipneumoniae]
MRCEGFHVNRKLVYPHARSGHENKYEDKTKSHRIEQTEREISTGKEPYKSPENVETPGVQT